MTSNPINVLTTTAEELQRLLQQNTVTSKQLVTTYLKQIEKHNPYLHAVIETTPEDILYKTAETLDAERASGKVRSRLHGIPVLVKDNIATHPELGLDTTGGSFALAGSRPTKNAGVVERLIEAGLIIIGKANLSEFAFYKGDNLTCGWSAVGGQTQSAYVRGGVRKDDSFAGHSNPGGSSSGSAVGVSAGFAPISLGSETEGSLIMPASRAALYTIKPTLGLVSSSGLVPITSFADAVGPMAKSVQDLAALLDVIADPSGPARPPGGFLTAATASWRGLNIGTLDPEIWDFGRQARRVFDEGSEIQLKDDARAAYQKVSKLAENYKENVPLPDASIINPEGKNAFQTIFARDFKLELEAYLSELETPKVKSLTELVEFNKEHSDKELPADNPSQSLLEAAITLNVSDEEYKSLTEHARKAARDALHKVFNDYDLNLIIGPTESSMDTYAAAAGYPIASVPLGYLEYNGRAHGLAAIAAENQDALLIQFQSAWQANFPERQPPPLLKEESTSSTL